MPTGQQPKSQLAAEALQTNAIQKFELPNGLRLLVPTCPGVRYIPGKPLLRSSSGRGTADDTDQVYYQILGLRGEFISGERDLPLPADEESGLPGEVRIREKPAV